MLHFLTALFVLPAPDPPVTGRFLNRSAILALPIQHLTLLPEFARPILQFMCTAAASRC